MTTSPDLEALRALVAKWRNRSGIGSGSYHISPEIRECADELEEALERLLASQGKPEANALPSDKLREFCERLLAHWDEPGAWGYNEDMREQLRLLLSQEPSSGEAQNPFGWYNDDGEPSAPYNFYPGTSKPTSKGNWIPLFASPVTGGDEEAIGKEIANEALDHLIVHPQNMHDSYFKEWPSRIAAIIRKHLQHQSIKAEEKL